MIPFRIVTSNLMIPVPPPLRVYGQMERAVRVKEMVKKVHEKEGDVDVWIFNELIPPPYQEIVLKDMKEMGFVHQTMKMGNALTVNSGVFILSKHPITQEEITTFGDKCIGVDCFASKGVIYARICKNGLYFNVLATHMQAWPDVQSQLMRDAQIEQIRKFINSLRVPSHEPLFFCGDLNIDMYLYNAQFKHLCYRLQMKMPPIHPDSHRFTLDPQENKLVGNDEPGYYKNDQWPRGCVEEYYQTLECPCCTAEWIDYTLFSQEHLKPTQSYMKSLPIKVDPFRISIHLNHNVQIDDVTDHFPVLGHFEFSQQALRKMESPEKITPRAIVSNNELSSNSYNNAFMILILVFVSVSALLALLFLGSYLWPVFQQWRTSSHKNAGFTRQDASPSRPKK